MNPIAGDTLRGHLETLILSTLKRGEAHGFEILARLRDAGSGALNLKEGSLYPALYRLEGAKLIIGRWEEEAPPKGRGRPRGPRRRIYRITAGGRKRLEQSTTEFHRFTAVITQILGTTAPVSHGV